MGRGGESGGEAFSVFFSGVSSGIVEEWRGRKPCFQDFLRVSGIFSQLISEEDGWEEEGRKQEKLKSAYGKNEFCDHKTESREAA